MTPQGRSNEQSHLEVCADINDVTVPALIYHVLVAKRARRATLLGGGEAATEKFGPLKIVLEAIPALYANREVCLAPPTPGSPLVKTLPGNRRCGQQDRKPPLAHSHVGRTF